MYILLLNFANHVMAIFAIKFHEIIIYSNDCIQRYLGISNIIESVIRTCKCSSSSDQEFACATHWRVAVM